MRCLAPRGKRVTVSVNISVTNLLDPASSTPSSPALAKHQLPASALLLEITETTLIKDFDACKLIIARSRSRHRRLDRRLRRRVHVAAYLGSLAASELKLDRSFLARLTTGDRGATPSWSGDDRAGHKLNMRVVAEGIEDPAALDLLASLGCDLAQGYFISRPMSARTSRSDAHEDRPGGVTGRVTAGR